MKNHIKVNGKILQTNKKWSHLKQKQKEHISNWLRREYTQFVKIYHRKPRKYEHDEILHEVMNQIQEREIWIPYDEVKRYYLSKIG
ncbi:transposase [Bacillus cereus]|uniref:transposase n=1 Tax=Bacillus cereus TaxID=1396 RepID=UPI0018F4B004|nr:transposase [Bacillus cereus]MBJ7987327.1 transposase [Bacillus cereus]